MGVRRCAACGAWGGLRGKYPPTKEAGDGGAVVRGLPSLPLASLGDSPAGGGRRRQPPEISTSIDSM